MKITGPDTALLAGIVRDVIAEFPEGNLLSVAAVMTAVLPKAPPGASSDDVIAAIVREAGARYPILFDQEEPSA
jgi:CBS domain-containing protein